ncbi:actin cytoskeleton-regulatory complex protein pan-1-like [Portunus trituberculatus]|uniref:Uncharacterized protein n=1 Tax=Portunus trituberculatus TaxID=210409 RepID=A0A5B7E3C6_PORTR|nr:actin cytoskeleton-regulatory complex protein pan-1-like [Portunus trituberculatus]MPC27646.1 hypothetical protein [Portunus trituberculatus]
MATLQTILRSAAKPETRVLCAGLRAMCTEASEPPKPAAPSKSAPQPAALKYSSAATPPPPSQPVGPGADKTGSYPNTEYYSYNKLSYFDLEVEMSPDRLPQPTADNGHF